MQWVRNGGIFEEWFKNIAILIFMQSFHAIFLAFVCEIIGSISLISSQLVTAKSTLEEAANTASADGILAIITIVSIMALIKMEKMIKGIFGLQDSKFMGNIGENFAKGMAGIKSAGSMAKRTVEPAKRTASLMKDRVKNNVELKKARDDADKKKAEYDKLVKQGPSGSNLNRKQYMEKLKEARKAADDAYKDVEIKKQKGDNLDTAIRHSAVQTGSTFGSSIAAGAFGIGATDSIAEAAIVANLTDTALDGIANPFIKNTIYGKAAEEKQRYIEELPRNMARERVRKENPGIAEGTAEFDQKVRLMLDRDDFKRQVKLAIDAANDSKLELEMEIPTSKLRQLSKIAGDTLSEGIGAFSAESRSGRSYARNVRKNGIEYKGTNISNVDDI